MSSQRQQMPISPEPSSECANEELQEAEEVIRSYLEKGAGKYLSTERYHQTASKYERFTGLADYNGPIQLAKVMSEIFPSNRLNIKILDVAAGTGLSGLTLYGEGFRLLDAVDPAQGMLDIARQKNLYSRLICDYVDAKHQLDIPDNTYDAVTMCGAMGENQFPCDGFEELIRVTKPGGVIVNITRLQAFTVTEDYKDKIEPYFRKLEADGKWKEESRSKFPNFIKKLEGIVIIHRVLA